MDEGEFWSRSDCAFLYWESGDLPWTMPSKVDMGVVERSTEMDRTYLSNVSMVKEEEEEEERRKEKKRKEEVRLKTDATRDLYAADEGLEISLLGMSTTNSLQTPVH